MYILFWIFLLIILHSYLFYPFLLFIASSIINIFKQYKKKPDSDIRYEPDITLFIAAYNEIDFVKQKVENSFSLDYPQHKIQHLWVTDGSNDGTPGLLEEYGNITVLHSEKRNGKIGAVNRGMKFIKTPIVIFSDANSILNKNAVRLIVKEFSNPKTGCVAGEKRIIATEKDNAVNTGEGMYWKYESFIKKWESDLGSAIGAAGELYAIRANLFREIEKDTILDDFVISLRILQKGYKIKYLPDAYAVEKSSLNIKEELKRKTRIAYGGFQAILRLKNLLNPFKYPLIFFQYISHKILRWLFVPISIPALFFINIFIAIKNNWAGGYTIFLFFQILFYILILIGGIFQSKKTNFKILFTPYYIFIMNLSEIIGLIKFIQRKQSVNWERSKRG